MFSYATKSDGVQPTASDPNFNQVSVLLHGDGTNGAQNNTFLDSSTNNFTVTRNGNTTQGTNTPFSQAAGYWSNSFNGTNAYLTTTNNAAYDFGSGDFTVEAWVYTGSSSQQTVVERRGTGFSSGDWVIFVNETLNVVQFYAFNVNSSAAVLSGTGFTLNSWNHIAVVRSSTTFTLYLNGVSISSTTSSATIASNSLGITVGRDNPVGGRLYFNGYISNFRIVKGTAVYTANFTPSTTPLTAITNTSLLTCQSNRFQDNSSNNFTLTATGTPSVQPFSPFAPISAYSTSVNGGSMYFDGSGDYLTASYSQAALDWWTSDYTIEAWVYPTTLTGWGYQSGIDTQSSLIGNASPTSITNYWSFGPYPDGTVKFKYFNGISITVTSTATITAGQWSHIAMTKTSSGIIVWVNGVGTTVAAIVGTPQTAGGTPLSIGQINNTAINGYVSNIRIVKGTAVYTSNFTPPTAPLTAITNTQLLMSGTNAGIFDNAIKNNAETVGNAQVSTSVVKYGTGSMSFDGTGDWLTSPDTINLQLGTGKFTIEGWVYLNAIGSARGFVSKGTSTTGWSLGTNSSNQLVFNHSSSTITSTGTLAASIWYFVTVVREGTGTNQTKIYINGTNDGIGTVATDFNQTTIMYVGADRVGGFPLNGYIDDLRITKGVARYLANFTPPTQAFPNQ
jgi:hypothetical protein